MNAVGEATSSNFSFLGARYPELERIAARSERYFSEDPIISLMTVRRFGEVLAQLAAAGSGLFTDASEAQAEALDKHVYARMAEQDQRRTIIIAAGIARDLPSLR